MDVIDWAAMQPVGLTLLCAAISVVLFIAGDALARLYLDRGLDE